MCNVLEVAVGVCCFGGTRCLHGQGIEWRQQVPRNTGKYLPGSTASRPWRPVFTVMTASYLTGHHCWSVCWYIRGNGLEGSSRSVRFPRRARNVTFPIVSRPAVRPVQPLINWEPTVVWVQRPELHLVPGELAHAYCSARCPSEALCLLCSWTNCVHPLGRCCSCPQPAAALLATAAVSVIAMSSRKSRYDWRSISHDQILITVWQVWFCLVRRPLWLEFGPVTCQSQ
jgi:hypothetical protein